MIDVTHDSGKHPQVNRSAELMCTALALVAHHPQASAKWYASLDAYELQMLSAAIGDALASINIVITTLRGRAIETTPELVHAIEALEPLLRIEKE